MDDSFEELYRGHRAEVFRAALRELGNVHDAEDVTQAAFVDAYRAVLRGSEPHSPRAWLLAIGENVRRRRFRTAQRRPREEPLDEDIPLAAEVSHELAGALVQALEALPPQRRQAFVLRELAGLTYEEIAAEMGLTVGAVQMLIFRARRALRGRLEPPQVSSGRGGLVLPMPGWLTALVSRADVAVVTPRAVGAVGATVAAVVASLAINQVQAEEPARAAVEPPRAAEIASPVAAGSVSAGAARSRRSTRSPDDASGAASPPAPPKTRVGNPGSATGAAGAPPVDEPAATEPAAAPAPQPAAAAPTPEAPRVPVDLPEEVVTTAAEPLSPALPAAPALPPPSAPSLPPAPEPVPEPVPELPPPPALPPAPELPPVPPLP